ncbi:MAG: redoxin family protein [Gammaproteobacteria bacterium]
MFVNKKRWLGLTLLIFFGVFYIFNAQAKSVSFELPKFTQQDAQRWINSSPLKTEDLKGKVVLLDIWTYGCWNCYRSIPWLNSLEKKFGHDDFIIVGIHTPEFDHETEREKVIEKCEEFKVTHPVMMDNDFAYWKALRNRYWPTFYVADKHGVVKGVYIGETHEGDKRAHQVENLIAKLIAE